ncbi:MAG: type IV secretion system DNA-binding domain-containing protein [Phycisphaerae bacterium]|nr:type IV secretion system DNA-binding domain-containing protein [Phycisphaerae bacterium]
MIAALPVLVFVFCIIFLSLLPSMFAAGIATVVWYCALCDVPVPNSYPGPLITDSHNWVEAIAICFKNPFLYGPFLPYGYLIVLLMLSMASRGRPTVGGFLAWLTGFLGFGGIPWLAMLLVYGLEKKLGLGHKPSVYTAFALGSAAFLFSFYLVTRFAFMGNTRNKTPPARGRTLNTFEEAAARAAKLRKKNDPGLYWGGLRLPTHLSVGHFCASGCPGSGKTITLRLLLQSILAQAGPGSDCRLLIYDPKREFYPVLRGAGVESTRIKILNPLDSRSVAWNIAADVNSLSTAESLMKILVPDTQDHNQYFNRASQLLTLGVIETLVRRAPGVWTLRDVIAILLSDKRLERVLSSHADGRDLYERVCTGSRSYGDIRPTLDTLIRPYRAVAARWEQASGTFSISAWLKSEDILLMSLDRSLAAGLIPIYRVILEFASQQIVGPTESSAPGNTKRTWLIVDEAREAGKLQGLRSLMNDGRAFGARVVLAFQDYAGIRSVYGPDEASEVTGLCLNHAILRPGSSVSAEWAAGVIGQAEVREWSSGHSSNEQGKSVSATEHIRQRVAVLPDELRDLPEPNEAGVHGYFATPTLGVYRASVPFSGKNGDFKLAPLLDDPFHPRPGIEPELSQWTDADWDRLGAFPPIAPDQETPPHKPDSQRSLFDDIDRID